MKIKSFAMLVAASLLATSFLYVAPAMADDISNNGQAMLSLADNSANGSDQNDMSNNNTLSPDNSSMPSDNGSSTMPSDNGSSTMPTDNGNATMPSDNTMQPLNPPSNPNAAPGNSNDEGGPDTATGDDDY